ncbi:MAG: DUF808 domain-containing protein [Rhodobacteraceae bacterium]|nr:DUF808 domain-containing protein [Paracoccaceae bacterium]
MNRLLALIDDVTAIVKVAAASVDDIAGTTVKAGAKAASVVIDDAVVTPKYVQVFQADRELPIIWRIACGSLKNKLVILLPVVLALANFAPWAITPLLILGGAYLCFEGAEKLYYKLVSVEGHVVEQAFEIANPARLEEEKVSGAIKTDFILSSEIMTIALAAIPDSNFWIDAITLAIIGIVITIAVYGVVALIVKMDDVGLHMVATSRTAAGRSFGRGLLKAMPGLMVVLSTVGTGAMLWVGGNIIIHGMELLGWPWFYDNVHHLAEAVSHITPVASGLLKWVVTAVVDGAFGVIFGLILISIVAKLIGPAIIAITVKK